MTDNLTNFINIKESRLPLPQKNVDDHQNNAHVVNILVKKETIQQQNGRST